MEAQMTDVAENAIFRSVTDATAWTPQERAKAVTAQLTEVSGMQALVSRAASRQFEAISRTHNERMRRSLDALTEVVDELTAKARGTELGADLMAYLTDAAERWTLVADVMRERGDVVKAHDAAGCPPVLSYDFEVAMDGATLPRPCNYLLLRILPPEGMAVDPTKRPYVIIDPRAGHGAGIGGFKPDSQVGVALKRGNPVYFVAFRRDPEPMQTLADVMRAEAAFVREVMRLHPDAPAPVIAGNCQGGWATLVLAASNPDLTGPLLINGAPVDAWAGEVGKNPMRYNGGMLGGAWLAMLAADLGHGIFDGAHLVDNFEKLNPSRNYFGKYYDLYARIDTERARFLEFERWWGGFFTMTEAEIAWIVENIFIGNKLARGEARLEPGRPVDLKNIRAPIVIFTSHGDNITPPQQALNWIVGTYADADEIRIRGQRIIYLVHDTVGHLGIFVSASVANKEHTEVASVLRTIESLPPGLHEMVIERETGEGVDKAFVVSFAERELADIARLDDGRGDEVAFAAVARLSELQAEAYDVFVRPWVQAATTREGAAMLRASHPMRLQRTLVSSATPGAGALAAAAERVAANRRPVGVDNPFVKAERLWSEVAQQSMDIARDMRDAWYETAFYGIYASPAARWFGRKHGFARTLKSAAELKALPEVQQALLALEAGGFVEAVIRMLVLLADSRGAVRRDRLERATQVLGGDEPFRSVSADRRARIIHQQTLIAEFAPQAALAALPALLRTPEERALAARTVLYVAGELNEMAPGTLTLLQEMHRRLDLPPVTDGVADDPLAAAAAQTRAAE
jgi:hypothetical protein